MAKVNKHVADGMRLSTAAQFFLEDDVKPKETSERVVELLNDACNPGKDGNKLDYLRQAQELIVHKDQRNLLDNFLDEMMGFQHDRSVEVRKFIVGFIIEACLKDPEILPKVIANLNMMLYDAAVAVQKKVIVAATRLYKVALQWICNAKNISAVMESTWAYMTQLKSKICTLLDSENEGIRVTTIKFIEMLVITQTRSDDYSPKGDIALDEVPMILRLFRPRKMEEEAKKVFDSMVEFHGTPHISSANLMACMQSLVIIAKSRSIFFPKVIQALEALHANLPPTLAKSQVSSVRKSLKLQLYHLGKHPVAAEYHSRISTLLLDLGATPSEIMKGIQPPKEEPKKLKRTHEGDTKDQKRLKTGDEDVKKAGGTGSKQLSNISGAAHITAIDMTAEDLVPKLNEYNVTDLVLVSMLCLPDTLPAHFQSSYTPIAEAGTMTQIKHLSRLMATQFTNVGLGKGIEEVTKMKNSFDERGNEEEEEGASSRTIRTLVGGTIIDEPNKRNAPVILMPTGVQVKSTRKIRQLNLSEIVKPLSAEQQQQMIDAAMNRISNSERSAILGGATVARNKILASLATHFRGSTSDKLINYILDDPKNRSDLAFSWLYEEYATYQCFGQASIARPPASGPNYYDETMQGVLIGLLQKPEMKDRDILFGRFYFETPCITGNMALRLKEFCQQNGTVDYGMHIAKTMIEQRPHKQLLLLGVVCELTLHETTDIRTSAVNTCKCLHEIESLKSYIEAFAIRSLKFLLGPTPPNELIPQSDSGVITNWDENTAKVCLHLCFTILPSRHKLIHELANVYVGTTPAIKRVILRFVETPVKSMGMSSPELLKLVENCPRGAETLITRLVHILTDKAPPSGELVARIRDLYHKRVSDVRFLIPVLHGLTKKEVIAALPKLIKLNPGVVKEVFNRLLGSNIENTHSGSSPLTPAELLIYLHNIDSSKCDMKTIMKATSLCFIEKHIYTQEVLAVVMQQLMEQNPLPTLFMRTVLQSLSLYPRLIGFVMNILQRLILKQVWKQKKVWEGFIKCCQRTKPQSFQVLLQLPAAQLHNVFETCPDLKEPLCQHIDSFTDHQKAHIPQEVLDLLSVGDSTKESAPDSIDDAEHAQDEEEDEEDEPPPPGQELTLDLNAMHKSIR